MSISAGSVGGQIRRVRMDLQDFASKSRKLKQFFKFIKTSLWKNYEG